MQEFNSNLKEIIKSSSSPQRGNKHFSDSNHSLLSSYFSDPFFAKLISSRILFRKHCKALGLEQPEFLAAKKFQKLSDWIIKRQSFPAIMKPSANQGDFQNQYLLRAFRELPEFFSKIRETYLNEEILIEDWLSPKFIFELTYFNGALILVSQTAIDKSLELFPLWRVFPLSLPPSLKKQTDKIIEKFSPLINSKNLPVRFSFGLVKNKPILLSVNSSWNRPEYYPEWNPKLQSPLIINNEIKNKEFFRIQFFRVQNKKDISIPDKITKKISTCIKYETKNNLAIFQLKSMSSKALSEHGKMLDTILREYNRENISTSPD